VCAYTRAIRSRRRRILHCCTVYIYGYAYRVRYIFIHGKRRSKNGALNNVMITHNFPKKGFLTCSALQCDRIVSPQRHSIVYVIIARRGYRVSFLRKPDNVNVIMKRYFFHRMFANEIIYAYARSQVAISMCIFITTFYV